VVLAEVDLVVALFRSFRRKRDRIRMWAAGAIDAPVVLLASPRATRRRLASLGAQ
jgi:hypothetical protein